MVWRGRLQPTAASHIYQVRITARRGATVTPEVFVESPELRKRNGQPVPHLYSHKRAKLCLWKPGKGEWSGRLWIAETVLLWTVEWLFFYEIWRATGEWIGGGEHPDCAD